MTDLRKLDRSKLLFAVAALLWSALLTYIFRPLIVGNQDAVNVIVTVFSILAGFLIAVITLLGDPKSLPSGGWQVAKIGSEVVRNRLLRHKLLFYLYLTSLALIFISTLIKDSYCSLNRWIEAIYLFCSFLAFFASFKLPGALMKLQQERIDQEIEARRALENIKKVD